MGGAFCALSDDASAIYYNPAGLAEISGSSVFVTYEPARQSDLTHDQIFSQEPLNNGGIEQVAFVTSKGAVQWRPLSNSTVLVQNGNDWESDQVKINAYTVSAAHKENSGITTGINLSYLSGLIAQSKLTAGVPFTGLSSGYGFSMDLGFLYSVSKQVNIGLNLRNLAGYMWWENFEKDQLPFTAVLGSTFIYRTPPIFPWNGRTGITGRFPSRTLRV